MSTKTNEVAKNEVVIKNVEIKVRECTSKEDGRKFNTFKALTKTGKYIDCKFRKEVQPPSRDCVIVVKANKMNVANNTKYPVLWVSEIVEIIYKDSREADEKDLAKVNELF